MPITVHVSSLLAGTYCILVKFLNKLSILIGLVEIRDDRLEQSSVAKLQLVYACDRVSMWCLYLPCISLGLSAFSFIVLCVYLSRHYVALGAEIC